MTLRKQLLILLLVHLFAALAAWDGYRIGLKRGRAERLMPQNRIEVERNQGLIRWRGDWRKDVTYLVNDTVQDPDSNIVYIAVEQNRNLVPKDHPTVWLVMSKPNPSPLERERWDANWRLN